MTNNRISLWPQLASVKVLHNDPVTNAGLAASVKGARGEGVAVQVVLTSSSRLENVVPELTTLTGANGISIPPGAVQLYRVGYIHITRRSDTSGPGGTQPVVDEWWPDPLYPIGSDWYSRALNAAEQRNGVPFTLEAGRNQPIWIEVRIPADAVAGQYNATLRITEGGGPELVQIPLQLTVWNFTLLRLPALRTTYLFDAYQTYCFHYYRGAQCVWEDEKIVALTDRYIQEALAHRITLNGPVYPVRYTYANGQITIADFEWVRWDQIFDRTGITSFPIPPPLFGGNISRWNDPSHVWTVQETDEAIAFWRVVLLRYQQKQQQDSGQTWLDRSFLYTYDEPLNERGGYTAAQQKELVARQSNALNQAWQQAGLTGTPPALVTSAYDTYLSTNAQIGIWTPVVNQLENNGGFAAVYGPERAAGKQIWWYDSINSIQADRRGGYGNWPSEFIDHAGVNQLVHGPLTWKYQLDGYLYYATTVAYYNANDCVLPLDPWRNQSCYGANGDGTLFYPGVPSEIGGSSHIPVPSIRLQLLRQSWTIYDTLVMLREQGKESVAQQIVSGLVQSIDEWSHDELAYEAAREQIAAELSGQPPAVSGRVMIADFSSGAPPAQVRYWEDQGQYPLLNGWHDPEDVLLPGNFMRLPHDQVLFINRLNQNNGRVLIADFSSGTPPAQSRYVERWGQFDLLDSWHDPEDIQLAGDFMKLGYDQVLFINTKDAGDGRVMIADFSGGPPAQVRYWENWGQSSLLNGWHDPEDIRLVGDFMHLGYDQVMFINVVDRKDGRVMIADFSSGTPPAKIKYLEGWGQFTLLNGWHDDPEDFQLAGDFMNLGYDQVLFINGKDAGDGRVMIADFSSGAPPAQVRYSEKWGQFPLLDAWHNPGDWLRAGDFMGLGYDQVLFINRLNQNDGRVMIADFSSGNGPAQVKYWENWGQSTLLDGWQDNPDLLMKGNFFGTNIQLLFINQGSASPI